MWAVRGCTEATETDGQKRFPTDNIWYQANTKLSRQNWKCKNMDFWSYPLMMGMPGFQSVQFTFFGPDWDILISNGWITIKLVETHPEKDDEFGDPLTLLLHQLEIGICCFEQNTPNNYWMDQMWRLWGAPSGQF